METAVSTPTYKYQFHPATAIFAERSPREVSELAAEIKRNGLLRPIVLYGGMILDGRARYEACISAEVQPFFATIGTILSPEMYVINANILTRQLSKSQRGAIGAFIVEIAQDRAMANGTLLSITDACNEAVNILKVGWESVRRARIIKNKSEVVFKKVLYGEMSIRTAEIEAKAYPVINETYTIHTPRQEQIALAEKRRLGVSLGTISGHCRGLQELNMPMVFAVSDTEEIETWARMSRDLAKSLRLLALKLESGR